MTRRTERDEDFRCDFTVGSNVTGTCTDCVLPLVGVNRIVTRTVTRCFRDNVRRARSDNATVSSYVPAFVAVFAADRNPEPDAWILPFPATFTRIRVDVPRTVPTFDTVGLPVPLSP